MATSLNLSEGKVLSSLLKFTLPIFLSVLLQITYGTVDLLIVSQFAGVNEVSGVTIGSQIMQSLTALCAGLSMGTTILLGQYIGAKKPEKAEKTIGVSICMFSCLAIFISAILIFFNASLAEMMRAPLDSFSQTQGYLFYSGLGGFFVVAYNLLGSIFRGLGDSKTPLVAVTIACIINIILDLVFVIIFGLGARGAALATTIAQASSVFVSLYIIRNKPLPFRLSFKIITFSFDYAKNIIKLGLPIALQALLVSFSFLVVTAIINKFGVAASAGLGICEKICSLIMIIPMSFMQALSAFTAQNYGAKKLYRAKAGLKYSILISLCIGAFTSYIGFFHGTIFTQFFTNDPQVTLAATSYLKSYAIDVMLVAFLFSFTGYFNGCSKTAFVMIISVTSAFAIRIPLAYFFSTLENTSLFIIGLATPIATVMQITCCFMYYHYLNKEQKRTELMRL